MWSRTDGGIAAKKYNSSILFICGDVLGAANTVVKKNSGSSNKRVPVPCVAVVKKREVENPSVAEVMRHVVAIASYPP